MRKRVPNYTHRVTSAPPFRADIVGSFLRPDTLATVRRNYAAGTASSEELREVEDVAIATLVAQQADAGLRLATDGEFRRSWWHLDFWGGLNGFEVVDLDQGVQFEGVRTRPRGMHVTGEISFDPRNSFVDAFRFLKAEAEQRGLMPKVTIPSPTVLDFRLDGDHIDPGAYTDREAVIEDVVHAYRDALNAFYDAGARYIQLDDTAWGYLCSAAEIDKAKARGIETSGIAERYARLINRIIADRPSDLVVTTHVCRGNFRSTWIASGGYEPVAEQLLSETAYDGYFLEYDSDRAGGFEPLRYLPHGDKRVVLGLVTTKTGELEDGDAVRRRIDEAAEFAPLDQLALSPQCGFASTEEGNLIDEDDQWAKVRRVVEVSRQVWA